jgi:hypothetical protein
MNGDKFIIGTDSTTPRRFRYNGTDDNFGLGILTSKTNTRVSLLSGNKSTSTWVAVSALDLSDGSDIWFSLLANQRYAMIVVAKNDTGMYYYLSGGDTVSTQFTFGALVGYPVFTIIPNESWLPFFMTNTTTLPTSSAYEPPLIDTVTALINHNLYVLVKK